MRRKPSRVMFPYVIVFAVAVTLIASFGMMAELRWWEVLLWAIGSCLFLGGVLFTFFEVRRITGISMSDERKAREEEEVDRSLHRTVTVAPAVGDPYLHHEDFEGSEGHDQGQLTAQLPGTTPLVEELIGRLQRSPEPAKQPTSKR